MRITKDQFQEWQESEVTQAFMQFAIDWSNREGEFVKASFLGGGIHTVDMHYLSQQAGKAIVYAELNEIDFDEIEEFYESEKRSNQDTDA